MYTIQGILMKQKYIKIYIYIYLIYKVGPVTINIILIVNLWKIND